MLYFFFVLHKLVKEQYQSWKHKVVDMQIEVYTIM